MYYWPLLKSQLPKERLREMEEQSSIHSYDRKGDEETIFFTDATILRVKKGKEKIVQYQPVCSVLRRLHTTLDHIAFVLRHFDTYASAAYKISKNSLPFFKGNFKATLRTGESRPTSYDSLIRIVEEHGGASCIQQMIPVDKTSQIRGCDIFNIECSDGKKIIYDETLESAMFL